MSNEKYYSYYRVTGPEVAELNALYTEIEASRKAALAKMLQDSGAIAYTESGGWGNKVKLVQSLVFAADYDFGIEVTIKRRDFFNGKQAVIVRGKGSTKAAREFNARIQSYVSDANSVLRDAPDYQGYLIQHYQVESSGFGAPVAGGSKFGVSMISTYCGQSHDDKNTLLFAIPDTVLTVGEKRRVAVPASFEEITYGQFYDMTNAGGV